MPRPIRIAPSVLSADFGRLGEEVRAVDAAGADYIHVDVMDGRFVPNLTIGPVVVAAIRRATQLPLDVHLMIEDPDRYIDDFARAGADLIGVHVEACRHLHRVLQQIRATGRRASVTLNPATPIEHVQHVLGDVSQVLLMSVNPGFGGQAFIPVVLEKLRSLRAEIERRGLDVDIEIDGGIKPDNIAEAARGGGQCVRRRLGGLRIQGLPGHHPGTPRAGLGAIGARAHRASRALVARAPLRRRAAGVAHRLPRAEAEPPLLPELARVGRARDEPRGRSLPRDGPVPARPRRRFSPRPCARRDGS